MGDPTKLTFDKAEEIRHLHFGCGVSRKDLAIKFGVSRTAIGYVVNGKVRTDPQAAEKRVAKLRIHGQSRSGSKLYRAWVEMRRRCYCLTCDDYPRYGGRGILVCDRWADFAAFAADMGPHPGKGLSIDRKDNDGNYEPGNCRWLDSDGQAQNRSSTRLTMGKAREIRALRSTMTLSQLAKQFSVSQGALGALLVGRTWKELQCLTR